MHLREIKELMASMGRSQISRLALKREGFEIEIERKEGASRKEIVEEDLREPAIRRFVDELPASKDLAEVEKPKAKESSANEKFILSPMVGTFYASPSPDAPSFLKVGDRVEKGQVVCIIEAMKVMNEVKSTESGVVVELLVRSEEAVEFGSKLFKVQLD